MTNTEIAAAFAHLTTPNVADAAVRLSVPLRVGPPALHAVDPTHRLAGRALPVRHYGSADIFFEAMRGARPGDVLVIDNGGRNDEACIGDLVVLEAKGSGLAGIVTWGLHRDTLELTRIGFPVFSCGTMAVGPRRLEPPDPEGLLSARLGDFEVTHEDVIFGDADGVVVVRLKRVYEVLSIAAQIAKTEGAQAEAVRAGRGLREQLRFEEYLTRRKSDPSYTFRAHLRKIGGAIEE